MRWNAGTSWPIEAGHPCLGCSEPAFWDGGGFYRPVSVPTTATATDILTAGAVGALAGGALAALAKKKARSLEAERQPVTVDELEQKL